MTPSVTRLAVVLSHPTQYYSPWFRWLCAHTDLELRVFYLWDFGTRETRDPLFQKSFAWDIDLLSGYAHEFVPNTARPPTTERFGGLRNPTLFTRLRAWNPGAILLFGYAYVTHLQLIAWARLHRLPLIFRGDSHFIGRERPPLRTRIALGLLYRQFAAFAYVGQANRNYFRTLGVPSAKLFFAPHAVNAELFDPARPEHRSGADELRRQLHLAPSTKVVLFAGKFVPAKQPRELLAAFLALNRPDTALVFVGDGEEKVSLQTAARAALPGRVHFLPFANQSEIPARYLLADVFALPSRGLYETWGLAVNEAMHMGVPCLVSDRVGCQQDLVTDGETGWVFRVDAPHGLTEALGRALDDIDRDAEGFRRRVSARIARYSYAAAAVGLQQAIAQAVRT